MEKCVYCDAIATDMDALGLPACSEHAGEADEYVERETGCNPNADTYKYCDKHCDAWQPGCPRCEECSQYHYGLSVSEFLQSSLSEWAVYTWEKE